MPSTPGAQNRRVGRAGSVWRLRGKPRVLSLPLSPAAMRPRATPGPARNPSVPALRSPTGHISQVPVSPRGDVSTGHSTRCTLSHRLEFGDLLPCPGCGSGSGGPPEEPLRLGLQSQSPRALLHMVLSASFPFPSWGPGFSLHPHPGFLQEPEPPLPSSCTQGTARDTRDGASDDLVC